MGRLIGHTFFPGGGWPAGRKLGRFFVLRCVALIFVTVLIAGSAAAQGWREYTYPDLGFALHFPDDPKIEDTTYMTASGILKPVRIYSLKHDAIAYRVIAFGISGRTDLNDIHVVALAL